MPIIGSRGAASAGGFGQRQGQKVVEVQYVVVPEVAAVELMRRAAEELAGTEQMFLDKLLEVPLEVQLNLLITQLLAKLLQ